MKWKNNNKGMTLLEVMLAIAIISICSLLLLTTFGGAANMMRRGVDIGQGGDTVYQALEASGSGSAATVSFQSGSQSFSVPGEVRREQESVGDPTTDLEFWLFVADDAAGEGTP